MNFRKYDWDDANIEHIARHHVTFQEVEETCFNSPFILKSRKERYTVYGQSDSGRYLVVIIVYQGQGRVRVITARDMSEIERKLYHRKRG